MLIELLAEPVGDVVAREIQFGAVEGEFLIAPEGEVRYVHSADNRQWNAGKSLAQFRSAVAIWNSYTNEVSRVPESKQSYLVGELRAKLEQLGVVALPNSVWAVLLEQAEQGAL
jgi:hypothetical protein